MSLVTGASSGIGKEFARQIAALGINVVLVARRDALLTELGRAISQEFDVQYLALAMDLSHEGFIAGLAEATHDIDIGLVVSNAGTGNPGEFLKLDRQRLLATLRLNTMVWKVATCWRLPANESPQCSRPEIGRSPQSCRLSNKDRLTSSHPHAWPW